MRGEVLGPEEVESIVSTDIPLERLSHGEYISYTELFPMPDMVDMSVMLGSAPVKPVVFSGLTMYKRVVSFDFMMAYRLVDIFLGNDETHKTLLQVTPKLLVLVLGYATMENKRQEEFLIQVWENQRMFNNRVWLFSRGCRVPLIDSIPQISRFLKENKILKKESCWRSGFHGRGNVDETSYSNNYGLPTVL